MATIDDRITRILDTMQLAADTYLEAARERLRREVAPVQSIRAPAGPWPTMVGYDAYADPIAAVPFPEHVTAEVWMPKDHQAIAGLFGAKEGGGDELP